VVVDLTHITLLIITVIRYAVVKVVVVPGHHVIVDTVEFLYQVLMRMV
tara:strand:+ start:235 stop:378 length:144 start_codon:yes stop_codon:yes gene_type:complete